MQNLKVSDNDLPFIDSEESVKEYLEPMPNGDYRYHIDDGFSVGGDWIEIHDEAETATLSRAGRVNFWKDSGVSWWSLDDNKWEKWVALQNHVNNCGHVIIWERCQQEESLNDKVASAEVARQEMKVDNVNNPSHYNKGGIECIEAIKASMTHEAFCGYLKGNIIKYTWRYEVKGGAESLQKAQWYTNRLLEELSNG